MTALARGLMVMQSFKSGEESIGNQELAARCGLPKSTISRLTYTLTKLGFLHHDTETGRYRLGLATLALGGTTLSRLDVREVSRPLMQRLADQTGSLIAIGIRDGMSMLYIDACRSNDSIITIRMGVGSRVPIANTAMGRAYLAASKPIVRRNLESRIKALDPKRWPHLEAGIRQALAEYDEYGCCTSYGHWRNEVHSIAAPMRLGKGMPLMLMCVSGPTASLPPDVLLRDIRPLLLEMVRSIEAHFTSR